MLDLQKSAQSASAALPFEVVLEALDAFEPSDLRAAYRQAAERFQRLALKSPRTRAENIELDRLDSALGFLLGENGLVAQAGRLLVLLVELKRADRALRRGGSEMSRSARLLQAASWGLSGPGEAAEAVRRTGLLLEALARAQGSWWGRLFRRARRERAAAELVRLLAEEGEKAAAALPAGEKLSGAERHAENWLIMSAWLSALRACQACAAELERISSCVRESLLVESASGGG